MKILVVCQHYWPESFQVTEVCEELVKRGHEVTALVGLPNYPSGVVDEAYRHRKNRIQEHNGVHILRAPEIGRGHSVAKLALNYYSYAFPARRMAAQLSADFDVIYVYQLSPVMMAEPAITYKQLHGTPMLLYCCDLWPESMKVVLGNRFKSLLNRYEKVSKRIYQQADILAIQSVSFEEYFTDVLKLEGLDIRYLPQFANGEFLDMEGSDGHEGTVFCVLGNIGRAQDVDVILKAIAEMEHKDGFRLDFVGDGPKLDMAETLAQQLGIIDRVRFCGRHPLEKMPDFYRGSDACLLALNGDSRIGTTLPSRLQGYMAAGKPVLAAINGGASRVIEESGCGKAVPAGDHKALASLLDDFIDNKDEYRECGSKARAYFKQHFMRQQHMDALEGMLSELCGRRP